MRNKILVVDDVDINREILRSILEDEYTILEAENGKQALEIVDQEAKNMAAILLDLVMPEMDGTQVLEELNRRGDRKSTRLNSSHYQQSRMPSSA